MPLSAPAQARLSIALAALLWSSSGFFTKVLSQPTALGLHESPLARLHVGGQAFDVQMACYRVLFAGLVLLPTVRPRDVVFRPMMLVMLLCFAGMNVLFLSAMTLGPAANAILLQYSAPLWLYLAGILWLGERPDRRGTLALAVGLLGIAVIAYGGWNTGDPVLVALALGSGVFYAGVLLGLRLLRDMSPGWLTVWNHLLGGLLLLPFVLPLRPPTGPQFALLFLFGALQMGLPYWLMARGLRHVSAQEAGTITLLEPILSPLWAYLSVGEVPTAWTYVGGALILAALAWRYAPRRAEA